MADYRKMYLKTASGTADAIDQLTELRDQLDRTIRRLIDAQQAAEDIYIETAAQKPEILTLLPRE